MGNTTKFRIKMDYYYYILKRPVNSDTLESNSLPEIVKIRKGSPPSMFKFTDRNQAEGPFDSLYNLKKNSLIFKGIKLQKHRERVLKNKNIEEIKDYVLMPKDSSYEKTFIKAIHHTLVGKISKQKVKGVHFYNTTHTRIIKKVEIDKNGVYSAWIERLNENTGKWIKKDNLTNFFPDKWTINNLFHECSFAYFNKKHISGSIYKSKSISGVIIKFVINEEGQILTMYPEISKTQKESTVHKIL